MKITKRIDPVVVARCVCGHTADQHGNIGGCGACRVLPCPCVKFEDAKLPTRPGFYWALWMSATPGTHEGEELTLPQEWEVVEVVENFIGDPCEADRDEKFLVAVTGVRESQWPDNFKWGERIQRASERVELTTEIVAWLREWAAGERDGDGIREVADTIESRFGG